MDLVQNPLYLWILHLQNKPTTDGKKFRKNCICTKHIQIFFLSLFSQQYSITTTYLELTLYYLISNMYVDDLKYTGKYAQISANTISFSIKTWVSMDFAICRGPPWILRDSCRTEHRRQTCSFNRIRFKSQVSGVGKAIILTGIKLHFY
jgi:hypothetical protein